MKETSNWIFQYVKGKKILLYAHIFMNPLQHLAKTLGAAIGFEWVLASLIKLEMSLFVQGFSIYIMGILLAAFANAMDVFLCEKLECEIRNEMKHDIVSVVLREKVSGMNERHSGEVLELCERDVEIVAGFPGSVLSDLLTPIVVSFICIVALSFRSIFIAIVIICCMICVFCVNYYFVPKYRSISQKNRENAERLTACFEDGLVGGDVIRTFRYQKQYLLNIKELINYSFHMEMSETRRQFLHGLAVNFLGFSSMTVPFVLGALLVVKGNMKVEGLMYVTQISGNLLWFVDCLVNGLLNIQKISVSSERIRKILGIKVENSIDTNLELNFHKPAIKLENIHVTYGQKEVLKNISFEIPCGWKVAFVGESGSGKTTIFKVLQQLVSYQGNVTYFGTTVIEENAPLIRKYMCYISQEMGLFDDSIYENISVGDKNADEEAVICAAKDAYANEFIEKYEEGMDRSVGEFGGNLSGGQQQRITLARGFLRKAPIVLLDEVTSALDSETEKKVLEAIDRVYRNATVLSIVQKLDIIQNVDMIYVLKNGEIVEFGSHEDLMSKKGEYYKMVLKQKTKG